MNSVETFSTDRLRAVCMSLGDFDKLCQMHQDPNVMATLGGVRTKEMTRQFLEEKLAQWDAHGFGYWMFHHKREGHFVGRGGLQYLDVGGNREVEVGYSVLQPYWGQGFATEMARAMLKVGFEQVDLDEIVCFTLTTNHASRRVMQKVGFQFDRNLVHHGESHVLYRLLRKDYIESQRPGL
ncbi:GNAT family N-acetyltransferase [Chloroflexi bacterium TSY]|nr:GNAT family N-acetyltransferase [Chloroflexi bacterium TSY]